MTRGNILPKILMLIFLTLVLTFCGDSSENHSGNSGNGGQEVLLTDGNSNQNANGDSNKQNGKNEINEKLFEAVKNADINEINRLLNRGADVNYRVLNDTTLTFACSEKQSEVALTLIKGGADINATTTDGFTPLALASRNGMTDIVKILIRKGADINVENKGGYTPLHYASEEGHTETVKVLLEAGARVDIRNVFDSTTALDLAKNKEIQQLIVDRIEKQKMLANKLVNAVREQNIEETENLIKAGADINTLVIGMHPLMLACETGNKELVKLLIEYGANLNQQDYDGYSALLYVTDNTNNVEIARLLLKAGANPNIKGFGGITPLHTAVFKGNPEMVELLIEYGADVNAKDEMKGETPLDLASGLSSNEKIRSMLLKAGAKKN